MNLLIDGDGSSIDHFQVIDFGDAMHTTTINDLAIAIAYCMLHPSAQIDHSSLIDVVY